MRLLLLRPQVHLLCLKRQELRLVLCHGTPADAYMQSQAHTCVHILASHLAMHA